MNVHKRFIVQFFIQLILVFILLFITLLTVSAVIGFFRMDHEITNDLSKADSYFYSDRMTIQDKKVTFDNKLKRLAKEQNGWVLVLTEKGDVIGSYNAPKKTPTHFSKSELAALMLQNTSAPADYTYWKLEETYKQPQFVLYGRKNTEVLLLNEIKSSVDWKNRQLNLSAASIQLMKEEKAWVQLISATGKVVDEYGADKEPASYSIPKLITLSENAQDSVAAYYDARTKQTIIVSKYDSSLASKLEASLLKKIGNGLLIVIVLLFLVLISGSLWYARKLGIPLLTMMQWIQNLGSGIYEQPLDLHQRPIMLNKRGKLKRKFRLYKDLITTLSQLTANLQQNQNQRKKMTQTREEWISGLSHDLKTPLSSISGYAQMLEAENYSWTEREIKEFAGIIAEKSAYMMDLLEDLTLTFRLKNEALPIVKEEVDINEFVRQTIIHFINDPANQEINFNFNPHHETILASIDPKWFQRIIDNLIANAIKYNRSGTTITISISPIEQHLMIITVEDDGIGMDNETINKLFQRYYRGTNTSDSGSGTGLGMAITKQLVQLHDGSIKVKSTLNKGTIVRIILPI